MSGVERLPDGRTRFTVFYHEPASKRGGSPTWTVYDRRRRETVFGPTTIEQLANGYCDWVSNPLNPSPLREIQTELSRQLAMQFEEMAR